MENNWLDIQHRGFAAYLSETEASDACRKLNRLIVGGAGEKMDTVLIDCAVKTDWIERIEAALPFIENAVREGRQFILRQGDTVPIEKVKRVSKASVEHLSRHSELITSQPEPGKELVPDKLHMTENVGTYAVYENRFLYMLLCFIRDFAGMRYRKIMELAGSFATDIALDKQVLDGSRKIEFSLRFSESAKQAERSGADKEIDRIRGILQTVELLLRTDLMRQVSEAPILKPPVTRTNVMLHDPNFKAAFDLYAFLAAYSDAGYEQIRRWHNGGALSDDARSDLAVLVALTSYLSYRCGGWYDDLQARFLEEEQRRMEEADRAEREKIAALKAQIGPLDGTACQYVLALEQRLARLDSREDRLEEARAQCARLQEQLDGAEKQSGQLVAAKRELEATLAEKDRQHDRLRAENERGKAQQEEAQRRFEAEYQRQQQAFLKEYEALAEKYHLACARSRSFPDDEDCSSREAFAQLDAQFRAFKRFYDRQWKLAKKQIRKTTLWNK